jgi:hypothetical protein
MMHFVPSRCKNRAIHGASADPFRPIAPRARIGCLWLGMSGGYGDIAAPSAPLPKTPPS